MLSENDKSFVAVIWSNGQIDKAATWDELEEHVRATQWWAMEADEFRAVMQKRAHRWSLTDISTVGTSEEFFAELQRADLVRIIDGDNEWEEV
jgi:hypothetical protein